MRRGFWTLAVFLLAAMPTARADTTPDVAPSAEATAAPQAEKSELTTAGPDLSQVNELVRAGSYPEAETALSELRASYPDDGRLLLLHGEVLLALGRPEQALPTLRRAAELDPERTRVHFQLATALQATGEVEAALEEYAREIAINEDVQVHVFARLNRSLLLGQLEQWAAAAGELEAVVALDPGRLQAYGDMASLYIRAGKLEEAERSLERGLDAGYRSARHLYALGARFYKDESYDSAVEILEQALEVDANLPEAHQTLANALDQLGREEEALPHLRRYLELRPDAPDAQTVSDWVRTIESR